ncbi:MAG: hypothetical protein ABSD88_03405 [Candidatus Korobacteraceae bacterium]|jgi:hypothetical protein
MSQLFRISGAFAVAVFLLQPYGGIAQSQAKTDKSAPLIIGFLGGFVHTDDLRHPEVKIAESLQAGYGKYARVEVFQNRQLEEARLLALNWIDGDRDGKLSEEEKRGARIVLFGHSWGASAVVSLARELERDGVPVLLTIQVDSISKHGAEDSIIPANVAEAANFYQPEGLLHGRSKIRAADASRTRILGNFRLQYRKQPPECRNYPWYDRLLFKGHTAIECDPRVWSRVQELIQMQLRPALPPAMTKLQERTFASSPAVAIPR